MLNNRAIIPATCFFNAHEQKLYASITAISDRKNAVDTSLCIIPASSGNTPTNARSTPATISKIDHGKQFHERFFKETSSAKETVNNTERTRPELNTYAIGGSEPHKSLKALLRKSNQGDKAIETAMNGYADTALKTPNDP